MKKQDFSETKKFKQNLELETRPGSPFYLLRMKGLFSGVLLLFTGLLYLIWIYFKHDAVWYGAYVFLIPGFYVTVKAILAKQRNR